MEKKLEVLSAALKLKEESSPPDGVDVDLSPVNSAASSEGPERATTSASFTPANNLDTTTTTSTTTADQRRSSGTTTRPNEHTLPSPFKTPLDSYPRPSPHTNGPSLPPPGSNTHYYPKGSGPPLASLSSTPESLTEAPEMNDIKEIRRKMVHLWNIMHRNSTVRLEHVENAPRMRTPTYDNDPVSQGVITLEDAHRRLVTYRQDIYQRYSLVELPEEMTVERLRRECPVLFLSIMCITSVSVEGQQHRDSCIVLHNQAMDAIIYETMIVGNKSLELLKCLILLSMWYNTPEMYHHQKSHLITHLCITLAIDLGLGGATYENHQADGIRYDRILKPYLLLNPQTPECRKLWLCVYISSIHVSTIIKRPVFLMWSKYTEECCTILEQPERDLTFRRVAALARLNHLHEEISAVLQSVESNSPPDVNDPKTRYIIRYFEHKLQQISGMVSLGTNVYATALYIVQIYLHEFVMYVKFNKELGRAPYCDYSLAIGQLNVSVHTAQAIGWCYSGATKCLEVLSSQSVEEIALLPLFCYSRAAFSASTLLKLRTLYLTTPEFHQICTVKSSSLTPLSTLMKKLDQVIERFPFANLAVNFCFVMQVLICHFDRQLHYFFHPEENPRKNSSTMEGGGTRPTENGEATATSFTSPGGGPAILNNNNNNSSHLKPPMSSSRRESVMNPDSPLDILSSVAIDGGLQKRLDEDNAATPPPASNNLDGSGNGSGVPPHLALNGDTRSATPGGSGPGGYMNMPMNRRLSSVYGNGSGTGNGTPTQGDAQGFSGPQPPPQSLLASTDPAMTDYLSNGLGASLPTGTGAAAAAAAAAAGGKFDPQQPDYPSWLVTDDFWKELVPGAEALSMFDMY